MGIYGILWFLFKWSIINFLTILIVIGTNISIILRLFIGLPDKL